jgi:disintegrin and metalloproteinase domain-containing protein 9
MTIGINFISLERSTALRDGLLVLFFLVVPLIALATFLFIKRDELRKSFFRKKRSQTYEYLDFSC